MNSTASPADLPTTKQSADVPVVLVADKLDPDGIALLNAAGCKTIVRPGMSPEELIEAAREADGILVRSAAKITPEVLAAATKLKAVGRAGIGVDNIDIPAASRHGVLVMNTPTANAVTTGELAIAHIFALARHIPTADASMKAGAWEKSKLAGSEITAKTLAVIGLGKIGRVVAERGVGLRMRVIAHDPFLTGESPVRGVTLVDLDTALAQADFLTIHVPKSRDTLGLIDADALGKMKSTAYVINCARGGIVVEDDLLAALDKGTISGAALDVFATEPLPEDSPLRHANNLVLTPHLGASSEEAQKRVSVEIAQQMADYLLRGEARNALNAPALSPDELDSLRPYLSLGRRCGLMLAQASDAPLTCVTVRYVGELAEQPTEAVRLSVLAGLLAPSLDGPVNAVNAPLLASERGLKVLEEREPTGSELKACLEVDAETADGQHHTVSGTVFRGQPRLVQFEGFGVDFEPQGEMLLTRHRDEPGVLGAVATWLGTKQVNIGGLHMAQPKDGGEEAIALYSLSRALTDAELQELMQLSQLVLARSLSLEAR
jgi:D-3-phosphoglycerate dehydrogenase